MDTPVLLDPSTLDLDDIDAGALPWELEWTPPANDSLDSGEAA